MQYTGDLIFVTFVIFVHLQLYCNIIIQTCLINCTLLYTHFFLFAVGEKKGNLQVGVIIGLAAAVVVVCILVIIGSVLYTHKRRTTRFSKVCKDM